jgi:hypothetical protein
MNKNRIIKPIKSAIKGGGIKKSNKLDEFDQRAL